MNYDTFFKSLPNADITFDAHQTAQEILAESIAPTYRDRARENGEPTMRATGKDIV